MIRRHTLYIALKTALNAVCAVSSICLLGLIPLGHGQATSAAEVLSDIPACAYNCVIEAFATAACNLTDVGSCVCPNITLQSELSTCTQENCQFSDQLKAAALETTLCAAYPKPSKSGYVTRVIIAGSVIVFPTIFLRLYSRVKYSDGPWADDYTTLFGAVRPRKPFLRTHGEADRSHETLLAALAVVDAYIAILGFGKHYWTIPVENGTLILKLVYSESLVYIPLQVMGKISILLLYARVFPVRQISVAVKVLNSFLVCHGGVYLILFALQCLPVSSIWNRTIVDRKCLNITAVAYSNGALCIFEDFAILILPIPQVLKLNIDRQRRYILLTMFSIGSFACVTSMVRLKYVVQYSATFDPTWDNVDIVVWSIVEQFSAMFCGSIPAVRLLLVRIPASFWLPRKFLQMAGETRSLKTNEPDNLRPEVSSDPQHQLYRPCKEDTADGGGGIQVTTTIEVQRSTGAWFASDVF